MSDTNVTSCQCAACYENGPHKSDCAVHGVDTKTGIQYFDCDCGMAAWVAWAHAVIP